MITSETVYTYTSFIVVSFNTRDLTLACLQSVYDQTDRASFELIVVDNASTDGSAEAIAAAFPEVRLIASERNLGFAGANNVAAAEARGEYILLLNPDTLVIKQALDRLVGFAEENPGYGIYGGRTVFADGSLNGSSCFREPTLWGLFCRAFALDRVFGGSGFFNPDCYGGWQRDTVREVDIVSGCFMLVRSELWRRLGGVDTEFFMYGEDWDLCMRARALGARCIVCPEAEIVHYGGASEPVHDARLARLLETKVLLLRKHWGPLRRRLGISLLKLWVLIRLAGFGVIWRATGNRSDEFRCWQKVWASRKRWTGD